MLDVARADVGADRKLHVFRDIDNDRPWTPVLRDVKSLVQHAWQILDLADQIIMLGAMPGYADRIAFLEGVGADEMGRHLAGNANERDRIHQSIGQAGHRIGGAWTGGHQKHAGLAARPGEALGGMRRSLFVAHQHMLDEILVKQGVVDRQDRAARIAENGFDSLVPQRPDDHFRSGHQIGHVLLQPVPLERLFAISQIWAIKKAPEGLGYAPAEGSAEPISVPPPAPALR